MNSAIKPEEALKRVNNHLEKADELLNKSYNEGDDEKSLLNTRIENFVRTVFKDDNKKLDDLYYDLNTTYAGSTSFRESKEEIQKEYIRELKVMKKHLVSYKDELELIIDSKGIEEETGKETTPNGSITQHFHGNIGSLALGDINTYNATIYFDALIKAIEESKDIPKEDKKSLIDKIKDVAYDPYVSGIGAAAIFEGIKALSMGVKPF